MSSCLPQSLPGVHFTRHLCCLPGVFSSDAVCREQPGLGAAWSQMAWCGWLWLCLLSPPDHHMMNHIPATSKTKKHTHTRRNTGQGEPTGPQHSSERSRQEEQLSSSLGGHGDYFKQADRAPRTAAQRAGKAENPARSRGAEGVS